MADIHDVSQNEFLCTIATNLLGPTTLPVIIVDNNFDIVQITKPCCDLFSEYYNLSIKNFFDIFADCFKKGELDICLNDLKSAERGFSWTGTFNHKSQVAKTIFTKLFFLPIFDKNILRGYFVFFRNITKELLTTRMNVLNGLLKASKIKDKDTGYHTQRVNYYSKLLAKYLHQKHLYPNIVNADFVENIGLYAAMHDIGKIGTPDYILQKPSRLSDDEWKIMQEHTINGAMILSGFELPMAQDIAISHHERWDGSGYPFRISNTLIPLSARIVAIGDVYDALRTKRPYKDVMTHEETVDMIVADSETHFDPDLIKVVKRIHPYFDQVWQKLNNAKETAERMEHM